MASPSTSPDPAQGRRAPVHEPRRPPGLLRLHPVLRHLAGRARGLHRERVQRLRRLLDGVGRAEPARARGARLVQGLGWLPRDGGGLARQRRLGGEHDRARLRARDARRPDVATISSPTSPTSPTPRSHGRRGSSASGRPGAGHPGRRGFRLDPATLPRRWTADSAAAGRPFLVVATAGATNAGAVDPLPRACGALPRARRLVPRRRRLRRLLRADRPRGAKLAGLDSPTRSRSIRTSGSTSRTSAAACSCATGERCATRS